MVSMRVLLVSPRVLHAPTWWCGGVASKPHLHSLAGFVRDVADVSILELDTNVGTPNDATLPIEDVDLVGISCWTSLHYLGALQLIRRIRAERPELPIVVGGHHPTAVPQDFDGEVDFVVRGDGEEVLRRLCETKPRRPGRTEIVQAAPYQMSDPSRIDWTRYPWHDQAKGVVWLCLSRGCPFKCAYCAEPQRGSSWPHYSVKDALAILESLEKTHQPKVICFSDPLFGASRPWTEALLEGIAARQLSSMFWCETRADLMSPSLLERFRACRFKVDFGLDTGSETMARYMVKSPAPSAYLRKARDAIRQANSIELFHDTYVLFNFPGETPDTTRETMEFVETLSGDGPASGWVSSQSFFILPGTDTFRRLEEFRERFGTEIRHPDWWRQEKDHNLLATDVLPSHAWRGREHELMDFKKWQDTLNLQRAKRHSAGTAAFMKAFYGL
jgi:radical SAM superfamily enzyme YgiQ (UPF0313 family)